MDSGHGLLLAHPEDFPAGLIGPQRLNILVLADGIETNVGHAQLLALVDVGRALHHVEAGAQHLGRQLPVRPVVPEAGHDAGLVVIVPVEAVPALVLQAVLPAGQDVLQILKLKPFVGPLAAGAVLHVHVVKIEHHVELPAVRGREFPAILHGDAGRLAHGHDIVL